MEDQLISSLALISLTVGVGVALFRLTALRLHIVDVPNSRSMHHLPTPRGGGMVVVVVWVIACTIGAYQGAGLLPILLILLAISTVSIVGAFDDFYSIGIKFRLSIQFLMALLAVFSEGMIDITFGPTVILESGIILNGLTVIGLVWLLNLFNFMDGTDGLAACESLFIAIAGGSFLFWIGDVVTARWLFYLVACMLGFLVWNFPPARVFMGDSGSSFLGFFFGIVAITTHNTGSATIWFWLILMGVFIVDATFTLLRRFLRGERVYEAHKTHAFQRVASRYKSHLTVMLATITFNILWLLPMALLSQWHRDWGFLLCVVAYTPLVWLVHKSGAGTRD